MPDQGVLGQIRECDQNTNLDCHIRLCANGDCQEDAESGAESLSDVTNVSITLFDK
jgi:hypothetical protein